MPTIFDSQVYRDRLATAQKLCQEREIAAIIVTPGAQLAYLSGSWISTHERFCALVVPATGTPCFILPAVDRGELVRSAIPDLDVEVRTWQDGEDAHAIAAALIAAPGAVAVGADMSADHLLALQSLLPRDFLNATSVLAELFVSKDAAEIEQLALAGEAIDRVHEQVPELLRPGRSERDVAADLTALILEEHEAVDFVIVGSMENGANPHHDYSERELQAGEMVVVDIGGTLPSGYHSDCTRTYIVGGPRALADAEMERMYATLFDAQRAATAAVRPGVTAASIDAVAREHIARAGYGEAFIHRTGHGIGLSTHEEPFIMAGNDLILRPGMAFSIEPGIYLDGRFGARIEDIVVVTDGGCRSLNNTPRELQ